MSVFWPISIYTWMCYINIIIISATACGRDLLHMRGLGRPAHRQAAVPLGPDRREHPVDRTRVYDPRRPRLSSTRPSRRPLPARPSRHVQEGGEGRTVAVAVRTTRRARHTPDTSPGAVPHAPGAERIPVEHLLRGFAAERRLGKWVSANKDGDTHYFYCRCL